MKNEKLIRIITLTRVDEAKLRVCRKYFEVR